MPPEADFIAKPDLSHHLRRFASARLSHPGRPSRRGHLGAMSTSPLLRDLEMPAAVASWRPVSGPGAYLLAAAVLVLAVALRLTLLPTVSGVPYLTYYPAVVLAFLLCGTLPGALVTLASAAAAAFLFRVSGWGTSPDLSRWVASGIFLTEGAVIGWLMHAFQRSRATTEQALSTALATRNWLRTIHDSMPEMLHSIDQHGRLVAVSDVWLTTMGYQREEVLGRRSSEFLTAESRALAVSEILPRFFRDGFVRDVEYQMVRKDGARIDVRISAVLERDAAGEPVGSFAVLFDITRSKSAERALAASEARYRLLVEDQTEMVSLCQPDGTIAFVNHAYAAHFGKTPAELLGTSLYDYIPEAQRATVAERLRLVRESAEMAYGENNMLSAEGTQRWVAWTNRPLLDPDGRVTMIHGVGRDISERRTLETQLQELNAQQRAILNSELFGIALLRNRHFVWTNPGLDRILGYPAGTLAGQSTRLMYQDQAAYAAFGTLAYAAIRSNGSFRGEQALVRADGEAIWVEMTGARFGQDPDAALWIFSDVTARRNAELALRQSQAMLARTGAVAGVGGWELDLRTQTVQWSEETCRILGAPPGHQPTLEAAIACYLPEDQPVIRHAVEVAAAGGSGFDLELRCVRFDGEVIWVRAVGTFEMAHGAPVRLVGAFQDVTDKVQQLRRIQDLYQVSERQRSELAVFRDHAESEAELASFLLSRLCHVEQLNSLGVSHHWIPAETFSGDVIAVAQSSSGDVYAMLSDATGHGLAAAINLIPLTSAFYAMAAKGFNLLTITDHLNRIIKDYSLPDRFVAVTLTRWVRREGRLEVINSGNPRALLLDRERRILREFKSGSIPLGILERPRFKPMLEAAELAGGEELLMFSDGLIEACDQAGQPFGMEGLTAALADAAPGQFTIDLVRAGLARHAGDIAPADDVSVLILSPSDFAGRGQVEPSFDYIGADEREARRVFSRDAAAPQWRIATTYSWRELQKIEVVPVIVDLARTFGIDARIEARVFTVLSELFVNALEHGLLRLESSMKAEHDGFERYLSLRNKRLRNLREGEISVVLQLTRYSADCGGLHIEVHDSGDGFDHRRCLRSAESGTEGVPSLKPSGRGLALLGALCDSITFNEQGNSVAVELTYS